ncbi:MAG: GNAT family N-acetyltransferase [Pseudomonadota bacterium]
MVTIRFAETHDLSGLLALYHKSGFSDPASGDELSLIWRDILGRNGVFVIVAELDGEIVSSCTLITAPNLLRGGQAHGFLENIATLPPHRRCGYGRRVIEFALSTAWEAGCFHVMMQSGKTDPGVHAFYRTLGFQPGLRTAYVHPHPSNRP